jgi:hypothetical protein
MLRTLGIPTRLATGYSASGSDVGADGWRLVRGSDAHAWVEVWIRGRGWVSSDPTAGSALAEDRSASTLLRRVTDWWGNLWASDSGRRSLAIGVVLLGGACVLTILAWRRRRAALRARHDAAYSRSLSEPLAAFARFRDATATGSGASPPGSGVRDARRHAAGDDVLLGALDVVERTLYASRAPSTEERFAAAAALDRRTAQVLAARSEGAQEPSLV